MEELFKKIKERQFQKEESLSHYASKSKDYIRLNDETDDDIRTSYTRDIDRIIHSNAYTRYIDKTQVFIRNENDHITHRIIHVQLVSKIAKTIGRALNLNEDLIEAIALGHDIGHTPFGHMGESFLNEISLKEENKRFAHNLHSVRTYMNVENKGQGINLCLQTLDGMMCHNGEMLYDKYEPKTKTKAQFIEEYNKAYYDDLIYKKLTPSTLEGCVVRISDIIGYIGRDIEDAIKLGVIKREDIPKDITDVLGDNNRQIVNNIILDIINNSYEKPYLKMSPNVATALNNLKSFNYENIYYKSYTKEEQELYRDMFNKLFYFYKEELVNKTDIAKIILGNKNDSYIEQNNENIIAIDYIAGFTDGYLINQYNTYIQKSIDKILKK